MPGSLRTKAGIPKKHKTRAALQTSEDIEQECGSGPVQQNDMKEYHENEPVDQCNVTVNTYGAKLQNDEKATTRANTGLNDRATAQATTVHVKTVGGRTLTINCNTGRDIEKAKTKLKKNKDTKSPSVSRESRQDTEGQKEDNCGQHHKRRYIN